MEHAHGGHRPDGGVRQMNPTFQFSTGGDNRFHVLSEDGQRVLCRRWREGADGNRHAVLAVLPAAEHPTMSDNLGTAADFTRKATGGATQRGR